MSEVKDLKIIYEADLMIPLKDQTVEQLFDLLDKVKEELKKRTVIRR